MKKAGLIVAALLAAVSTAAAASGQDVVTALRSCKAETDQSARLACFDRLAAQYDTAVAPSAPVVQAAPVASAEGAQQAAPAPVAQAAPPAFGGENLRRSEDTAQSEEAMTAAVAKFSFNAIGHFTVVLDNGQVWRQLDSDTVKAKFRGSDGVKISKGFMDSYSLVIVGKWGTFGVKRIK